MRRAALIAALALAGCGGDGGDDETATRLLERGFATDVETGVIALEAELELEGGTPEGPFRLELEGPFRMAADSTDVADLDLEFRAVGAGREYEGRVTVVRDHAWIEYRGVTYEVGEGLWERFGDEGDSPETLREAGVDPLDWVEDVERAGKEDAAGTPATKVTARLDGDRLLRDVNKLSAEPEAPLPFDVDAYVDDSRLEAWIGDDGIWRRVTVKDDFEVPDEQRDAAGGAEGGRLSLDVRLADPNEPVEIEGPADARPIDELLRRLGIPPELLLGPGFAEPSPG